MIDTHQHLWNPPAFKYPWLQGIPALNRPFLLDDYRTATQGCGITASVFVECAADAENAGREADWILALAGDPANGIAGVVASAWPERAEFARDLDRIADDPSLKGIRRVLHTEPDELSQSSCFVENLKRLGPLRLVFDLCVLERQLPHAIALVRQCPEVTFVLDHCGVPDIAARTPEFWKSQIAQLAACPNVVCKVSGLLLYAAEHQRTAEGLRPWFAHVVETFGWERLVWGGDWPVCSLAVPLARWLEVTHELLNLLSTTPEQREAFLEGNARRIYHL
jgi:predicted TIM-barrel fold metal-dependent hydrolase